MMSSYIDGTFFNLTVLRINGNVLCITFVKPPPSLFQISCDYSLMESLVKDQECHGKHFVEEVSYVDLLITATMTTAVYDKIFV